MTAASTITTAAQLLQAGDIGRCELVRGELIMMSPAGGKHGWIANRIAFVLTQHVERGRLGAVFAAETGFLLEKNPDTVRAADVAFVRTSRGGVNEKGFIPGAPDLAVQVLSPSDSASEVLAKVNDWLHGGTNTVWIVDSDRRTVAVYQSGSPVRTLRDTDEIENEVLLPGLRVRVADFFPS